MNTVKQSPIIAAAIIVVVGVTICVGVVAIMRIHPSGEQGNQLPKTFDYSLEQYAKIDPALIRYDQKAAIPTGMVEPRAVAVGPGDHIFLAGDKAIAVFDAEGKKPKTIKLEQEPHCLAVAKADRGSPGPLYVGMKDHVEVYDADGRRQSVWPAAGKRSVLTSIAVGDEDVFVADAGSLVVWHYDRKGKLLGQIGRRDPSRNIPGFVVPSPYFDVAIAPDGLLRVANPGMHQVEAFTFDGQLEVSWGKRGMGIEALCGCCNPSNIAVLSDGRIVTAEKGLPRVKVYSATGEFECVVVGSNVLCPDPAMLTECCEEHTLHPVDLAVDSRDRILVLDPRASCVRIFVRKPDTMKAEPKK
ncbi:MAG: hypothetical protein WCB27_07860 [Thermoguttaceae bacterium]|jgi:hypothetical protein